MTRETEKTLLLLQGILLIILFFGLIRVFMSLKGRYFFWLELAGLLFLVLVSFAALLNYHRWGKRVLLIVFVLYLLNLVLVWYVKGPLYVILVLLGILGLLLSIPWRRRKEAPTITEPTLGVASKSVPPVSSSSSSVSSAELPTASKTTTFTPGKFVASLQSNQFHAPSCEWAKKIRKERRVWFPSMDEAFEKGYRKHGCLK